MCVHACVCVCSCACMFNSFSNRFFLWLPRWEFSEGTGSFWMSLVVLKVVYLKERTKKLFEILITVAPGVYHLKAFLETGEPEKRLGLLTVSVVIACCCWWSLLSLALRWRVRECTVPKVCLKASAELATSQSIHPMETAAWGTRSWSHRWTKMLGKWASGKFQSPTLECPGRTHAKRTILVHLPRPLKISDTQTATVQLDSPVFRP